LLFLAIGEGAIVRGTHFAAIDGKPQGEVLKLLGIWRGESFAM
jgi:hypothetical protein